MAYPKQDTASVSGEFVAKKHAGTGELQYEIMTISREGSKEVVATGESYVEEKASGLITIYNNHSDKDQELIATTRFETPDGKIFRIPEGVVVPGQKTVNGEVVPGSIEVKVYADVPGPEYNIAATRFTIPGFKGSDRYEKFYAESKEAFVGGFKGQMKTVSESDKQAAQAEIQNQLKEELFKDVFSQKPEGFTLFEDGIFASYEPLPNESGADGKVFLKVKGTVKAIIFNNEKLSGYIARQVLPEYDGKSVKIKGLENFTFALTNKEEISLNPEADLKFNLSGEAHFVWSFDKDTLATDFVGKSKREIDAVLASYPGIEKAEVVIRPFWRRSFPDTLSEIQILEVLE